KHVWIGTTRMVSKLVSQENKSISGSPTSPPIEKDVYFYHGDQVGSSNFVTDAGGNLYEHLEYFPSGESWVEESTNTQRTPYLFTGKELDEETGLYDFGAGYYDPRTSVWQSADPADADHSIGDALDHDRRPIDDRGDEPGAPAWLIGPEGVLRAGLPRHGEIRHDSRRRLQGVSGSGRAAGVQGSGCGGPDLPE